MRRQDRGSVSAELAVAMPAVVVVLLAALLAISAAAAQLACVDAARAGARAAARGEADGVVHARAAAAAPDAAAVDVRRLGDTVAVHVAARIRAPGGLARLLPALTVRGVATAIAEDAP